MSVYRSKTEDFKKRAVKTLLNIFLAVKTEWTKCEHQDGMCVRTKIKKVVVHSNPFIKIIGIFLLVVRFVKSSDQTIIQIIRKNKIVLMFLIDLSYWFIGTYLKSSQHLRWWSL